MKQIILTAFDILAPSQIGHGLWQHPESQRHRYLDVDYWIDIALTLEKGLFDAYFIADVYGMGGAHKGSSRTEIQHGIFFPNIDPSIYVTAMARATTEIGFAVTQSTSFEPPFTVARRFSALDQVSKGRIGWNIVTSGLPSMSANHGYRQIIPHDTRYAIADEFLEVVYKLWEGSWSDGYYRRPNNDGYLFDPDKIHKIFHVGKHFDVEGPFSSEPTPQRTPVLFQAGNSGQGMRFAARNAEVILVAVDTPAQAKKVIANIREMAAAEFGRDPAAMRFLLPCGIIPDESERLAELRIEGYKKYWSEDAALANSAIYSGYDLASMDPEAVVGYKGTERSQTNARALAAAASTGKKVKDLIKETSRFGASLILQGGYQRIADEMEKWMDEGDLDGFNLISYLHPADYKNTVAYVVPELQSRGRYKKAYAAGTLREKMMGAGPLLPSHHTGATYRAAKPT